MWVEMILNFTDKAHCEENGPKMCGHKGLKFLIHRSHGQQH